MVDAREKLITMQRALIKSRFRDVSNDLMVLMFSFLNPADIRRYGILLIYFVNLFLEYIMNHVLFIACVVHVNISIILQMMSCH